LIPEVLDSLDAVEMVMAFEEAFGVDLPNRAKASTARVSWSIGWSNTYLINGRTEPWLRC